MSKGLKKKSHWTSRVHECVIVRSQEGGLGFELKGGAENGQFPYLGEVKPGQVVYESGGGKLVPEELLLEVNETPVAGLTIRDVLAVIKHCKDPIRLKCVKQGKRGRGGGWGAKGPEDDGGGVRGEATSPLRGTLAAVPAAPATPFLRLGKGRQPWRRRRRTAFLDRDASLVCRTAELNVRQRRRSAGRAAGSGESSAGPSWD
uniref:PDZ domain-containing protein n=1 Tax=Podarcis muralis TaxID=64176 RepID=A0A670J1N9_PODMU